MSAGSKPKSPERLTSYLPLRSVSIRPAVSVVQAVQRAPSLAGLAQLAERSANCLKLVAPLIPPSMRAAVRPGPLEEGRWCLVVSNNAAAAKLRQLLPALAAHLRTHGHAVNEIRIKIAMQ
jgi:hypothetical protein